MTHLARRRPGNGGVPSIRGHVHLIETERWEGDDPAGLVEFLDRQGLGGALSAQRGDTVVQLLAGARGCALLAGLDPGRPSPVRVPDLVAVALVPGEPPPPPGAAVVGEWSSSWTDAEHAAAVSAVREQIATGALYQANVVRHRSAPFEGDPAAVAAAVTALPGALHSGAASGAGWLVASASPELLVRVEDGVITTVPIKGTRPAERADELRASLKDRAEHVMIVDLERNDLARVARTGTVEVPELHRVEQWAGTSHAASTVRAELRPEATTEDVLRALLPGGSVTGAPKQAAWELLTTLEPVGRGPSMGALGLLWPGGMELGLTIRTVAVADGVLHLWSGGGITWGSDPADEVREATLKAAPLLRVLSGQVRPSVS